MLEPQGSLPLLRARLAFVQLPPRQCCGTKLGLGGPGLVVGVGAASPVLCWAPMGSVGALAHG